MAVLTENKSEHVAGNPVTYDEHGACYTQDGVTYDAAGYAVYGQSLPSDEQQYQGYQQGSANVHAHSLFALPQGVSKLWTH